MGVGGSTLVVKSGYAINDGNGGNNYAVTLQSATGTITPAPLTLAAVTDSRTYNATTSSAGVVQVSGLFGSDSITNTSDSSANVLGAGGSTLVVNNGYIVNDNNGGANYTVTLQSATGTITPAPLSLAAVTDSKPYDATTTSLALVQSTGLQGSDSVTGLTKSFDSKNAGARILSVNAGYTINDGNSGGNYTVSLLTATGSITPATLVLSAQSDTKTYDATINSLGTVQYAGLQGSDSVTGLAQSFDSKNARRRAHPVGERRLHDQRRQQWRQLHGQPADRDGHHQSGSADALGSARYQDLRRHHQFGGRALDLGPARLGQRHVADAKLCLAKCDGHQWQHAQCQRGLRHQRWQWRQ